jgi:hypothetical protein
MRVNWRFISAFCWPGWLATAWYDGRPAGEALVVLSSSALASLVCLALVTTVAWGYARSTIYSLTNRRLIIRHGLAMPITINVPFAQVDAAAMTRHANSGTGTICLQIAGRQPFRLVQPVAEPAAMALPLSTTCPALHQRT